MTFAQYDESSNGLITHSVLLIWLMAQTRLIIEEIKEAAKLNS